MGISTFNGINMALSGLLAQQRALDTTTHNIANANTEGYTRQEAVLTAADPLANTSVWGMVTPGQMGQGVTVDSYQRIRDVFNDTQLRNQMGNQASLDIQSRELKGIEGAMPEPGTNGIQAMMDKFWSAWQDLSNNPENTGARQALAQQAVSLASGINTAATTLAQMRTNDNTELGTTSTSGIVGQVNDIATQLASLNQQISDVVLAGATTDSAGNITKYGQMPNDLLDRRDKLVDDLSKLGNVTTTEDAQKRVSVNIGGMALVSATTGATTLTRANFDAASTGGGLTGGSMHGIYTAYSSMLDESVPGSYASQLNTLAQSLHDAVNTQHALGVDLNGTAGGKFFDFNAAGPNPPFGAAGLLTVAAGIVADPRTIAAGSPTEGPGSNVNALAIINLRTTATTAGTTFDDYYTGLQTGLGVAAEAATRSSDSTNIVVNALQDRRDSVSGVSLDEEMTSMIKFQHAFSAASRVLNAMDDNINRIINQTGRVGI